MKKGKGYSAMKRFPREIGPYIILALLLLILFIHDRFLPMIYVKTLVEFIISYIIVKHHFSPIIEKLVKNEDKSIYVYVFNAIYTFFVFIEIEFLLNRTYSYAFYAFLGLLLFTGGLLYLSPRGKSDQTAGREDCSHNKEEN